MRAAALALGLAVAGPAAADPDLLDFMGGQGCTFGPQAQAAARDAGFDQTRIDALTAATLANGTATQQRAHVVLGEDVCTIRLPDIRSGLTTSSPPIVALITEGCLLDPALLSESPIFGDDPESRFAAWLDFLAAGIIAGDLRFYGPSMLATPPGLQVMTGPCADLPDRAAMRANHALLVPSFGQYVRELAAVMPCDGSGDRQAPSRIAAAIQGQPFDLTGQMPPEATAWLWLEYEFIALAAGWHDGLSATRRGTPRPPLCHDAAVP